MDAASQPASQRSYLFARSLELGAYICTDGQSCAQQTDCRSFARGWRCVALAAVRNGDFDRTRRVGELGRWMGCEHRGRRSRVAGYQLDEKMRAGWQLADKRAAELAPQIHCSFDACLGPNGHPRRICRSPIHTTRNRISGNRGWRRLDADILQYISPKSLGVASFIVAHAKATSATRAFAVPRR